MLPNAPLDPAYKIYRLSTVDQVAALLREKIVTGELRPGTALAEVSLSKKIGVSRNTMREAIRVLVYEGLVQHSVRRGVSVTSLRLADVTDIYRVRVRLELDALDATRDATPEEIATLDIAKEIAKAHEASDWNAVVEWDMTFHRRLVGFLKSARLSQFYRTLLSELRLGLVLVDRTEADGARLVSEHAELYELVRSGRLEECKAALRDHLARSEQNVVHILRTSGNTETAE